MKEDYPPIEVSTAKRYSYTMTDEVEERLNWLMVKEDRTRSNMLRQLINEKYFEYNPRQTTGE